MDEDYQNEEKKYDPHKRHDSLQTHRNLIKGHTQVNSESTFKNISDIVIEKKDNFEQEQIEEERRKKETSPTS
ncbi:hypothetical protein KY332_01120 [Candidatus Woesearchaeota archaeon]|nr:hypothetical protein [Candidatus Woesearchaeota archaeon]